MKILIFGSSGFLGKNFLDHPFAENFQILKPDRAEVDLFDINTTKEYLQKNSPDIVINCAGKVGGIVANMNNKIDFMIENFEINRNLIISSLENKIKKFINFGSSCMYPAEVINPLDETQIMNGKFEKTNEAFALSKIMSLKLCEYISNSNDEYFYKTIIPCNMFGKFDHFNDTKRSHMVAAVISKVHHAKENNLSEIIVWGSGNVRREYTDAFNVADFVLRNLNRIKEFPNYFNLGVNKDYTVKEYYEMIMEIYKYQVNLVFDKSKPDGIKQKLMSTSFPININWSQPRDLKYSLNKTIEHYINYVK